MWTYFCREHPSLDCPFASSTPSPAPWIQKGCGSRRGSGEERRVVGLNGSNVLTDHSPPHFLFCSTPSSFPNPKHSSWHTARCGEEVLPGYWDILSQPLSPLQQPCKTAVFKFSGSKFLQWKEEKFLPLKGVKAAKQLLQLLHCWGQNVFFFNLPVAVPVL